jgi:serine phosphatase RsbU (regulator of sigma subunit)
MKKAERILGIVALSLFVLGIISKSMHWPSSGILLGLFVLCFNFGYLPLQLIRERRQVSSLLDRSYLIFRFITLFIVLLGFMFKIQHWPGAGIMLFLGTYMIPLLIAFYFYMRIKGRRLIPFQLNDLILAVLAYSIHLFISWSSVSPQVVNGYVVLDEQYSKLNAGLMTANQLIYSSFDSTAIASNEEILESMLELRVLSVEMQRMTDTLKAEFISHFYTDPTGKDFDMSTASSSLLASTSESFYFFLEGGRGAELKADLEDYMEGIQKIQQRHQLPAMLISSGFDLDDVSDRWGNTYTWEQHMFNRTPIASVITTLSWIDQVVLLTERGVQNQLTNQLDQAETLGMLQELANNESQLAIDLKENEILRISQQKELQRIQLEKSVSELNQRNTLTALAFAGIIFVLILLSISTRAYLLKQKANKKLALQKDEISAKNSELSIRNEEILAQRDEIEAQRDELEAQRNLVQNHKDQIEKTHNEISSSIDYAMRLQDAMLPSPALLEKYFSGHLIFFRPKQKVSGDFYWWTRYENLLLIAVADCTGHGVPGAFMSLLGASLLKEIVNKEGITTPGRILDRLREEVIAALDQKGSMNEQKDGMDMSLVCIDPQNLACKFAGAYNPLYLLRRGQLSSYRADLMPISYYEEMGPFKTTEIQLERGDQLYMFSDGYADQFGGEHRKKFKYKNFRQVITEYADLSMPRQQQVLSDTIREWQGKYEQTDDMVILGIRI